jgi:hypothetical protein
MTDETSLPFIDEFDVPVDAAPTETFLAAVRGMSRAFETAGGRAFSAWLRCEHRGSTFSVPPEIGQEANGFRVARADAPTALVLEGRHRFAIYRLSFLIDPVGEGRSRLRARTHARFPGVSGRLYRALVIGSGGHALIVRRMLARMASSAGRHASGS